jgi:hypothetical protein
MRRFAYNSIVTTDPALHRRSCVYNPWAYAHEPAVWERVWYVGDGDRQLALVVSIDPKRQRALVATEAGKQWATFAMIRPLQRKNPMSPGSAPVLDRFIAECCELDSQAWTSFAQLQQAFKSWQSRNQEMRPVHPVAITQALRLHGVHPRRLKRIGSPAQVKERGWDGIRLKGEPLRPRLARGRPPGSRQCGTGTGSGTGPGLEECTRG